MGNYKDLEYEFIERSLALISQYNSMSFGFKFKEQYNYTLLINCLLGIIVMPKERIVSYIPQKRLTKESKKEIGLENSKVNDNIKNLKDLIFALRHAIAHFDIKVESFNKDYLIDEIVFMDNNNGENNEVVRFKANELLPFIKYYSNWLMSNLKKYRQTND